MAIAQHTAMSTTISQQTNGRIRTTLSKSVVEKTGFHDFDEHRTQFRVQCGDNAVTLEVAFGPGIDADGARTTTPLVSSSTGQVQLEFPIFMARAWRLVDCSVAWEDGTIETDSDGTVMIAAPIPDWEPPVGVDFFELVQRESESAVVTRSGGEVENTYAMLPTDMVRRLGIESGDDESRLEPAFTCFQGRPIVVLEPTDADRDQKPHSRAVTFAGPENSQPRIAASEIVAELGIADYVRELKYGESVRLNWVVKDEEYLLGFLADLEGA